MPWISPRGGTYEVRWGSMTASEVFEIGEPVGVVDAGTLTEPPDDATEWLLADQDAVGNIVGIAAFGPGGGNINPATGAAFASLDDVAFWPADQGTLFITDNMFAAAAGSAVAPAQTDVGEIYQITYSTTAGIIGWGIERTAGVYGTDVCAVVHEVLDAQKAPLRISGGTGVYAIFEIKTGAG
jgi:hypothetical protein